MPDDLIRRSLVQAKTERWLVLPHLACDIISAAQLIGEALAIRVEHKTPDTAQSLCGQELDLGIWIVWLHQTGRVHLNPLQVDRFGSNSLAHLNSIPSAMLAICGRQMHQVWSVLRQERVLGEIRTKTTRAEDDRTKLSVV